MEASVASECPDCKSDEELEKVVVDDFACERNNSKTTSAIARHAQIQAKMCKY